MFHNYVSICEHTGAGIREASVLVVELDSGEFVIIASLALRKDTQLISIDPTTGILHYRGRWGFDVFASEGDALQFLKISRGNVKSSVYSKAILGYAALGSVGLLLLATRLKCSIPELPCGDCVYTVVESLWLRIPLRNPQFHAKGEAKNAVDFTDIQIDGMHYFCETLDITRPFPSDFAVDNPDKEFVWNEWLASPFKAIGLETHCMVLLQV